MLGFIPSILNNIHNNEVIFCFLFKKTSEVVVFKYPTNSFNTIDMFQSLLKLKLFLVCGRIFKLSPESFWHDYMVFDDVFTLWYNKIFQIYLVLFLPQLFLVVNSI